MPGCDVNQPNSVRRKVADCDSLAIDAGGTDSCAEGLEHKDGAGVPRVFDTYSISRIQQEAGGHIECFLHARDDRDLLRLTPYSSRRAHIFCYRLPKGQVAESATAHQMLSRNSAQAPDCNFCPQRRGK